MLLEIMDVRVHYNKVEALHGVSLDIDEGQIVALIGANGAGKSTILKTISRIKRPTSGEVWYHGQRIDGWRPPRIVAAGIAHVPEGRRVFSNLTVLENLKMGAYIEKDQQKVQRNLEETYEYFPILKERANQKAGTLSGGEQQMLATGRALMSNPKVVLMDEPSLGLSPTLVAGVAHIITAINQRGVAILLVEQNARLALSISHRGIVLETGRVVLEGDSKELLRNDEVKKAYLGGA